MHVNRFFIVIAIFMIVAMTTSQSSAQSTGNTSSTSSNSRASGNTGGGASGSGFIQEFSLDSAVTTETGNAGGFIGSSGNSGFIGSSSGTGTTNRGMTRNTTATRNNASRANMNTGNRMGGQGGTSINTQRQVQPVYTLGFAAPSPDYGRVSSVLSQRMDYTVRSGRLASVQIELADGIAVANGSVASDHDKKVAENMICLQPGVSKIQSDIQVESSTAGQNLRSPSARRNQQSVDIPAITTTQGRQLVYVF